MRTMILYQGVTHFNDPGNWTPTANKIEALGSGGEGGIGGAAVWDNSGGGGGGGAYAYGKNLAAVFPVPICVPPPSTISLETDVNARGPYTSWGSADPLVKGSVWAQGGMAGGGKASGVAGFGGNDAGPEEPSSGGYGGKGDYDAVVVNTNSAGGGGAGGPNGPGGWGGNGIKPGAADAGPGAGGFSDNGFGGAGGVPPSGTQPGAGHGGAGTEWDSMHGCGGGGSGAMGVPPVGGGGWTYTVGGSGGQYGAGAGGSAGGGQSGRPTAGLIIVTWPFNWPSDSKNSVAQVIG
jgi:hypothetical protein